MGDVPGLLALTFGFGRVGGGGVYRKALITLVGKTEYPDEDRFVKFCEEVQV